MDLCGEAKRTEYCEGGADGESAGQSCPRREHLPSRRCSSCLRGDPRGALRCARSKPALFPRSEGDREMTTEILPTRHRSGSVSTMERLLVAVRMTGEPESVPDALVRICSSSGGASARLS